MKFIFAQTQDKQLVSQNQKVFGFDLDERTLSWLELVNYKFNYIFKDDYDYVLSVDKPYWDENLKVMEIHNDDEEPFYIDADVIEMYGITLSSLPNHSFISLKDLLAYERF